jgi:hypothetical protein
VKIVDCNGTQRDWQWLVANYGQPVIHRATAGLAWRLVELREVKDTLTSATRAPSSLTVTTRQVDGRPAAGVRVAWYWPDAPFDTEATPPNGLPAGMRAGRAVSGTTNLEGAVGFGMGNGAYYFPPHIGPHAAWIHGTNSDVILGLGMIGGTNHNHIDLVYQQTVQEDPPVVPPPEEPPASGTWDLLFQRLDRVIQLLEGIS